MIAYIHRKMNYFLLNYVDDFIGTEYQSNVKQAHKALIRLLDNIGVKRSEKKSVPPSQKVEFIGNLVDAEKFTIGVTPNRLQELSKELNLWRFKKYTTRCELESLIGKLQFVSNCVKPGRLFVLRLLGEMKRMSRGKTYFMNEEVRLDTKWWYLFLPQFQGTEILWLLDTAKIDEEFAVDACLVRAGGVRGNEVFTVLFPDHKTQSDENITHLELWSIIVALKLWGEQFRGKVIKISTDNEAVSIIVNSGCSQDRKLQSQLREVVWWTAKCGCKIKTVHLAGVKNKIPDLLSRWHEGRQVQDEFKQCTQDRKIKFKTIPNEWFKFEHNW